MKRLTAQLPMKLLKIWLRIFNLKIQIPPSLRLQRASLGQCSTSLQWLGWEEVVADLIAFQAMEGEDWPVSSL